MNVHFSIDDVIKPFRELKYNPPDSVFDLSFFKFLNNLNAEYGSVFTLYCYSIFEADGFSLELVPKKYWDELILSGFIRMGFHGCFSNSDSSAFIEHCDLFYKNVPNELISSTFRLHRYYADSEIISTLKAYGVKQLLCRDNVTQRKLNAEPSYMLDEDEMKKLDYGILDKDNIIYRKTNIMLESYNYDNIKKNLEEILCDSHDNNFVLFTHNKIINQMPDLIHKTFDILSKYHVSYIF